MDESWLIPYADTLTLLLAMFIVLFAMSSVDANKFQQLSKAFNSVFVGGTGALDFSSPFDGNPDSSADDDGSMTDDESGFESLGKIDREELGDLQERINKYIEENNLEDKFSTTLTGQGLLLTIRDNVLFESGSAIVKTGDFDVANEIANLLVMDIPRSIVISGHTDNVPISTGEFPSNWHLSAERAVNFMSVLLQNNQLSPEWFSSRAFGEYQPVSSNDSAEGRSKNRRVEILIEPRLEVNK